MGSSIAWLDNTVEEQRLARDLIALFSETESRDELGLGQIRDAFSDALFPGFSVVQTRARYYLFIPWCYTRGSAKGLSGAAAKAKGQRQERALISALKTENLDDDSGLIGKRAGAALRTLPSTIYWSGMVRYGVVGNVADIGHLGLTRSRDDEPSELASRSPQEWAAGVPEPPQGFPGSVPSGFKLTAEEAGWLSERIEMSCPSTLLAHLVREGQVLPDAFATPWDAAPAGQFSELDHARLFAVSMHGAALLYNLLVAEEYEKAGFTTVSDPVAHYREALAAWADEEIAPLSADLTAWDTAEFWQLVIEQNPNISHRTRLFVNTWIGWVRSGRAQRVADDAGARAFVLERERRKGKQSRFVNRKLLEAWSGNSGGGLFTYRWGTVRRILNDINEAKDRDASS
ncbi:DUF6361 family protein [Knoellia subterranea]|uniref:Uncharacterized protein n=1 Tax=Knoellia subterranea KCTC 19937 TaxID=1385521 RepID=A0A0A0JNB7_9MICO|nr:DUF6361 family protein [Knoellia subterranea]KGN37507.1 hypothetical protein N803_14165 [Knoellia subterranea KCTC 19937]